MAAPANKTTKDLSGKWVMNKTLSNSAEPALALQGISYLLRKGVGMATINLNVNQYDAPPKPPSTSTDVVTHIDIEQSASGLSSTNELRCLDDMYRDHSDFLFGNVRGQTRWVSLDEVDDVFLKTGWEAEGEGKAFILSHVESKDNGWTATQIWGFQIVEGTRRYCRNVVVQKKEKRVEMRLVYDYVG